MNRYITCADALKTLKNLLYETALNQFDFDTSVVFEDIAKNRLETWVDLIPTADVVEVVRCKDCTHKPYVIPAKYDISGKCVKYSYVTAPDGVCPYICDDSWYNRVPEDNFFCGFGERKEKENV